MEQYADFSYDLLPASWLFCFLDVCPNADHCMRHLSGKHIPKHKTFGQSVFPTVLKGTQCEHFKAIRKIRAAYGFDCVFQDIKRKDAKTIREKIMAYLGSHGAYYRYHHGEKRLTPEQQQWIIDLFHQYGYTENLRFDHYVEAYDFS